jgi:hypothetical protein
MRVQLTKKFPKRPVLMCLATLSVVTIFSPAAVGCSCVYLPKHSTAFRKASAVFIGEVVSKTRPKLPEDWDVYRAPVLDLVTFKVERRWKGARGSEVEAWVDMKFSSCGHEVTARSTRSVSTYCTNRAALPSLSFQTCAKSASKLLPVAL